MVGLDPFFRQIERGEGIRRATGGRRPPLLRGDGDAADARSRPSNRASGGRALRRHPAAPRRRWPRRPPSLPPTPRASARAGRRSGVRNRGAALSSSMGMGLSCGPDAIACESGRVQSAFIAAGHAAEVGGWRRPDAHGRNAMKRTLFAFAALAAASAPALAQYYPCPANGCRATTSSATTTGRRRGRGRSTALPIRSGGEAATTSVRRIRERLRDVAGELPDAAAARTDPCSCNIPASG